LQTAQFQPKSQSLKESIFYPNHRQIKKIFPFSKNQNIFGCKKRQTDNEKEVLGGNRPLAQWRVQW
jgi:hypothetical protein